MGFLGGSKPKPQIVGYKYYLGIHFILGYGNANGMHQIWVGEKCVWPYLDPDREVIRWLRPDSYIDPDNQWTDELKAYDGLIDTGAYDHVGTGQWSYWLELHLDNPLVCGMIRFNITKTSGYGGARCVVQVYYEGDWHQIYNDRLHTHHQYYNVVFPTKEITAARIKIENSMGVEERDLYCYEFNFDNSYPYSGDIYIDAENIFGGTGVGKEGGITGAVDVEYGDADQQRNNYLVKKLGTDISAYRGLLGVILKQVYVGVSAYLKPWSFLFRRTLRLTSGANQWYSEKAEIRPGELTGDDLNAIHIIRECLTDKEWGLGWDADVINDENFRACADVLYTEKYGLSIIWDNSSSIEDFIGRSLQIIAGSLNQNLSTGKWEIGLIRDDYDVGSLESFNEDQIIEIEDFNRPGYGEIVDQVTVNWHDKVWDKNRSITIPDPAMIAKQGGKIIESSFNYYSICNSEFANIIASRELQLATSMLASMRIKANRQMAHLKPNDVFKLSWSNLGIVNMVIRVLEVNYGNINKNEIILQCCEDVFGTPYAAYENPPDTLWEDSVHDPIDTTYRMLMEVPYWHLCNFSYGQDLVATLDDDIALMFAMAAKSETTPDAYDSNLLVRFSPSYDFENEGYGTFTSTAILKNNLEIIGSESDWIDLEGIQDFDLVSIDTYAIIKSAAGNEIVLILAVDTTEDAERIKIARGILDTKPSAHLAGDRIWFVSFVDYVVPVICKDFTAGDTPGVKFLTRTGRGTLVEGDATIETADVFDSRMIRPYLPGNFKINDERFPEYLYGQPTLTWNHRDRTHQDQIRTLVKHTYDGDYGIESGATYIIQFWNETGDVMGREITGFTGKTYTYSAVDEAADFGRILHKLRIKLWTVRGTYTSWQIYDIILERPLYGSSAGQSNVPDAKLTRFDTQLAGSSDGQSTASGSLTVWTP